MSTKARMCQSTVTKHTIQEPKLVCVNLQ